MTEVCIVTKWVAFVNETEAKTEVVCEEIRLIETSEKFRLVEGELLSNDAYRACNYRTHFPKRNFSHGEVAPQPFYDSKLLALEVLLDRQTRWTRLARDHLVVLEHRLQAATDALNLEEFGGPDDG